MSVTKVMEISGRSRRVCCAHRLLTHRLRKTHGSMVACLVLLVMTGCGSPGPDHRDGTRSAAAGARSQVITGTVQYVDVEGGFHGIVADDGTKLDPVNLPEDFRKDGVRVQVQIVEVKDAVSIHMWGKVVRIIDIKRLPPSGRY